jgi:DNA-binding response OmpR family regulator
MQNLSPHTQPGIPVAMTPMKRILIIEDNSVHQRLMENELRDTYEVTLAADGQTAQAYLSGDQSLPFELVVLDSLIPARPGDLPSSEEAVKLLSNVGAGHTVVVVSGSPTDRLKSEFNAFGVKRIFEKPFSLAEFRAYIDSLIGDAV